MNNPMLPLSSAAPGPSREDRIRQFVAAANTDAIVARMLETEEALDRLQDAAIGTDEELREASSAAYKLLVRINPVSFANHIAR